MKIVVPMAGMGKRMRPHTLVTPKPLIPVAGKPIVQRLVEDIARISTSDIEEIAFIIGDFGKEVEEHLLSVAESLGAKGRICYQREPLGTAHAILCAEESLDGPVTVAFADTLFRADFKIDESADGVLWVKQIDDPSAFGVIKMDESGVITDYVEKPTEWVSDLAMIGIYYFKDGAWLKRELQSLIDNNIIKGGEYQLPDALRAMTEQGAKFIPGEVRDWMDCGNKNVTVETNGRVLQILEERGEDLISDDAELIDSIIIPPCYIAPGAVIERSVVGPHVSVGTNSKIVNSRIEHSIVQTNSVVEGAFLENSMVGNHAKWSATSKDLSIGDYNTYEG